MRVGKPRLFLRGDTNGDGTIDISDALKTLSYLFLGGERPPCLDAADIFDSGRVEITSPIATLRFLFASGPPPANPFPNPGLDSTGDGLPCEYGFPIPGPQFAQTPLGNAPDRGENGAVILRSP